MEVLPGDTLVSLLCRRGEVIYIKASEIYENWVQEFSPNFKMEIQIHKMFLQSQQHNTAETIRVLGVFSNNTEFDGSLFELGLSIEAKCWYSLCGTYNLLTHNYHYQWYEVLINRLLDPVYAANGGIPKRTIKNCYKVGECYLYGISPLGAVIYYLFDFPIISILEVYSLSSASVADVRNLIN